MKYYYLLIGVFIALISLYIGSTLLIRTHEGLSDGSATVNPIIASRTTTVESKTTTLLDSLTSTPQSYINLLTSIKNLKMARGIEDFATRGSSTNIINLSDYDDAIVYLRTLIVDSQNSTNDSAIETIASTNNTTTTTILAGLSADNQTYIDLLTSYKNLRMAQGVNDVATAGSSTNIVNLSDYDEIIDYLRILAGIVISTKPFVPTTKTISLSK
jgi:hypothetical protein